MNNTKEVFDKLAVNWINESYNSGEQTIATIRLEVIEELLKEIKPKSLLDVGCGDGRLLSLFQDITQRIGIDYSANMVALAKKQNPNIDFLQADLNDINLENHLLSNIQNKYQVMIMMGVVHYLDIPSKTISSLEKIIENNGFFIISFRNKLFNLNKESKYHNSLNTQKNIKYLNEELNYLSKHEEEISINYGQIEKNENILKLITKIKDDKLYEGYTDSSWNPENHNNWRQFTPLEAVILLEQIGFSVLKIIPLINRQSNNKYKNATSFVIVSRKV